MLAARKGFTLVEIGVIIGVMTILSAFAITAYLGMDEGRDAAMIQSAQVSLQQVISQGAARLDVAPNALPPAAVLTAVQAVTGQNTQGVTFNVTNNGSFSVTVDSTGRSATFDVRQNGDVVIRPSSLNNFAHYTVNSNGVIQKI